ncbi:Mpo1-like protein [Sorangium sp. So ce1000]|uniref:Mpo1-like protein n=1 Tax=Sorangium sp. So ce1000 TaxID=3133325 RepID=UPI003F60556E
MLRLNAEWTQVLRRYKEDHQDPRNQACHQVGIPLIVASFPVGATLIGLPLAAAMFTTGWGFQLVGHYFEGKKPSFVDDKRSLIIGVLWCLEKYGVRVFEETPAP